MAIEIGQALVRLAADSDKLKGDLDQAKNQTNGWAKGVGGAMKTAMGGAVLAGAAVAVGAVASVGAAAFDMASDHREAQADLRAQFGLTAEEAQKVADMARESWGNNWGESIQDVSEGIATVSQQLSKFGLTSDEEIQKATEDAIALRDTFGLEMNESVDAAATLMEDFGLTGQEAMDFIAAGMQNGLNRTGDFLDTITEYSLQFKEGGAEADQFFGFLQSGLQGGMLGTDKAADAFKEFRVRIMDGSTATSDALEALGFDVDEVMEQMASGEKSVVGMWDDVTEALANTEDQAVMMQAGVGLIGTQFEDLGAEAVFGLDMWGASMEDINGATDKLGAKYDSFPQLFEATKRQLLVTIAPIADAFLNIAETVLPIVMEKVQILSDLAGPIFEAIAHFISEFQRGLEATGDPIAALAEALDDILPEAAMEKFWGFIDWLTQLWEQVQPVIQTVADWVAQFVSLQDIFVAVAAVVAAVILPMIGGLIATIGGFVVGTLLPFIAIVAGIIGVIALVRNAWENDWGGIRTKLEEVWKKLQPVLQMVWDWLEIKIPEALETLRAFWVDTVWPAIQQVIEIVWPIIQNIIETTINTIWNTIKTVVSALQAFWEAHGEAIMAAAELAWNTIKDTIDFVLETVKGIFDAFKLAFEGDWQGFGEKLREVWDTAWETIKTKIQEVGPQILQFIAQLVLDVIAKFQEIDWAQVGKDIIQGIANGIKNATKILKEAAKAAARAALDAAKGFLGMDSPSKAFMEVGQQSMAGFAIGLQDTSQVVGALSKMPALAAQTITNNNQIYLNANYRPQEEATLARDIRTLELLRG